MRSRLPLATLTGAALLLVVLAASGVLSGRPAPIDVAAASPSSPTASPSSATTPPSAVAATPSPSPVPATPSPTPVVTPEPTVGPCDAATMSARIDHWEGAAGSRIATVTLSNDGPLACLIEARNHPQLVDRDGAVLIDGTNPTTTPVLTIGPGKSLSTLVSAANYCGPDPKAPISVAFVLGDRQRIVASPATPDDVTLPPCLGQGQPATIDMHPWAA